MCAAPATRCDRYAPRGARMAVPAVLCALLGALPVRLAAQTGAINGVVNDSAGHPISGADVAITLLDRHGVSDSAGHFQLAGLRPGRYDLQVRRLGFAPTALLVDVAAGRATEVRVALQQVPARLDTVRTIAHLTAVSGVVTDDRAQPIEGAEVQLVGARLARTTDARGRFFFGDLKSGPYALRVRRLGFRPVTRAIHVVRDQRQDHAIQMMALPYGLPEHVVSARSGFGNDEWAYRDMGTRLAFRGAMSSYVTAEDLAPHGHMLLLEALRLVPGAYIAMQDRGGIRCVLVEGRGERPPENLSALRADDIEAVEIYPAGSELSETLKYRLSSSDCGPGSAIKATRSGFAPRRSARLPGAMVIWLKP